MFKTEAIGLVGGISGGKNSLADFIARENGGVVVTTSDIARRHIINNDLGTPTRELCRNVSCQLRCLHGPDYLLREAISGVPSDEVVIVSGLYIPQEVIALRALKSGPLVHVRTDREIRRLRAINRGRSEDECSRFDDLDKEDMHATYTDQRLNEVIEMADIEVPGNVAITDRNFWIEQVHKIMEWPNVRV